MILVDADNDVLFLFPPPTERFPPFYCSMALKPYLLLTLHPKASQALKNSD